MRVQSVFAALLLFASCSTDAGDEMAMINGLRACVSDLTQASANALQLDLIGAVDGESRGVFGAIQDIGTHDGKFFVLDPMANHVLVLSEDGLVSDTLGRAGSGPGEFEAAWKLRVLPDGAVRVFDASLWRSTTFAPDGRVETTRLVPDVSMGQFPDVSITPTGAIYRLGYVGFGEAVANNRGAEGRVFRGANTIQRWDGAAEDWVDLLDVPGRQVLTNAEGALRDPPFAVTPVWTTLPDGGVWYGDGAENTLAHYSREGTPVCRLSIPAPPIPITADERTEYYNPTDPSMSAERRQSVRERRADVPVPSHKPVMRFAFTANDGSLWVNLSNSAASEAQVWMEVDLESAVATRVEFPPTFFPTRAEGSRLWGIYRDSLRVPYVGVFQLDRD